MKLYIVATPIGNLADMTYRAVETLKSVDLIAAEDTRHSAHLLSHYDIETPMIALHDHNEAEKAEKIIQKILSGKSLALISDAGTPLISDPGFKLVNLARQKGVDVKVIPGACAAVAALSIAGLPSDRFVFEGFLSHKSEARKKQLECVSRDARTLIFYESPHRILQSIEAMAEVFGADREVVVARELTKTFETVLSGELSHVLERIQQDENQQKGEFVVLVTGFSAPNEIDGDVERLLKILAAELPTKQAAKIAAEITGLKKNALYSLIASWGGD